MYHITDLKKYLKCPRLYFYSKDEEASFNHYLRSDESLIELLVRFLRVDSYFKGTVGDSNDVFLSNKDKYDYFVKIRFESNNFRVKVPIMHKVSDDLYDIYFVHNGVTIKELDFSYFSLTIEVLKKLNIEINKVFLAYINKDYVFSNILDIEQLFILIDNIDDIDLYDLFVGKIYDFKSIINRIESTSLNSYLPHKTRICHARGVCPYYYDCFKEEANIEDDSILTLVSSANKDVMYKKGIRLLKDVDVSLLEGNRAQYGQIMASKKGGQFVLKYALKDWLKKLDTRPITFIDFEWDTYLIPEFDGMKPLDVLPFEFVLYTLDENDNLNKFSFLGKGDCRKEFAQGLIKYIPSKGPIVAYNAYGAECRRINELANYFEEYRDELLDIKYRFVDLAEPFLEGLVYDTRMRGNFTLKKLVNVVSNMDYKSLEINDGMKAVFNWRNIDKGLSEDDDRVKEELIKYCGLDAYGLYLVYKWLLSLI